MVPPAARTLASEGTPFRDDLGSAHERINRLEQENQALRAEIARLTSPPLRPSSSGRHIALVVALGAGFAVLAMAGAFVALRSGGAAQVPVTVPNIEPVSPTPTIEAPPPVTVATPERTPLPSVGRPADCATRPKSIDAKGNSIFRKECL